MLESEIAVREEKKAQLRPFIMEKMLADSAKKVETAVGTFSLAKLKKWTYPERIAKMEEDYKAEKAKTQSTGEATYEEADSLRFNIIKL